MAILGVPFDNITLNETIARIGHFIALRRPHYVVTANVDFIVQARGDVELHRILCDAPLVLCDGTPLVWASRWLGNPLPERVAGADLVPQLIAVAAKKRYRLFFLGASPESSNAAVAQLCAQYPDLIIAGHYSPPFKQLLDMDHKEIRRRIRAAKPDLLLVSFGCPKQEKWLAMHYRELKVPVSIGVGATIDFLAGQVRRAPLWMQRSGTEWLFRLAQEPRRLFRRYLRDLVTFGRCLVSQQRITSRHYPGFASSSAAPDLSAGSQLVRLPDQVTFPNAAEIAQRIGDALVEGRNCLLDGSNVTVIDSTGIALLLHLRKHLGSLGLKLVVLSPSRALLRVFNWMHLDNLFLQARSIDSACREFETQEISPLSSVSLEMPRNNEPLAWPGEVTAANAASVWECTRAYLAALPALSQCVVDLSAVRFIDSSGLGIMIRARKFAQAWQKNLVFTKPCSAVCNVIHLARLEAFLLQQPVARGRKFSKRVSGNAFKAEAVVKLASDAS